MYISLFILNRDNNYTKEKEKEKWKKRWKN